MNNTTNKIDNLTLWDAVSKTDPQHTKHVAQRGGYTAIDPTYQLKEATKRFGPYGTGFGLRNLQYDYALINAGLVVLHAEFFYLGGAFEISNAIQPVTKTKNGEYADADFAKKLETNTLSKALSKLGFNADVFLGQFDDMEYVNHRAQEAQVEKAIDQEDARLKMAQAFNDEMTGLLGLISNAQTMGELKGLFTKAIRVAQHKQAEDWIIKLTRAKDQRKAEIEQPNQPAA